LPVGAVDHRWRGWGASLAVALSLLGIFWAAYFRVPATNFSGHDEWLVIWLDAKGFLSFPYANRPLQLFWSQPVGTFFRGNPLGGYWLLNGLYLSLASLAVLGLGRRLLPSCPLVGYLAAAFAVAWAPLDSSRLDAVAMTGGYSGSTLATLVSLLVFVESWRRSSPALLGAAAALAFVAARAAEATIPLLGALPFSVMLLDRRPRRQLLSWAGAWGTLIAALIGLAIGPVLSSSEGSYQASALGFDPHPLRVVCRLLRFFSFHLGPVLGPLPAGVAPFPVLIALAVFAVGYSLVAKRSGDESPGMRPLLGALLGGALAAVVAYFPYSLSPALNTPLRTQMLSGPGIGFLLAAFLALLVRPLPRAGRVAALAALACWIVALGTGRTIAMQREWDRMSAWPAQSAALRGLTRLLPDVRPNTFVLLFDETDTWPATFSFRHAVDYVYDGRATGAVWGRHPFLYPFAFTGEGLVSEPWPIIRRSWRVKPTFHRHDELVVARLSPSGLEILEEWPDTVLPALPAGAVYDPDARIVRGGAVPEARAILSVP
jgi:hypothetical protein